MAGTSGGLCVGHMVPEAMEGGPIAVLPDGDMIEIDIPSRKLSLELSEEDIRQRLKSWKRPEPKVARVYLAHFANMPRVPIRGPTWNNNRACYPLFKVSDSRPLNIPLPAFCK
jgi:dihydroxyacid dehydratase/phosphogluconate dehydratase